MFIVINCTEKLIFSLPNRTVTCIGIFCTCIYLSDRLTCCLFVTVVREPLLLQQQRDFCRWHPRLRCRKTAATRDTRHSLHANHLYNASHWQPWWACLKTWPIRNPECIGWVHGHWWTLRKSYARQIIVRMCASIGLDCWCGRMDVKIQRL